MKTTVDKQELINWINGLDDEALLVTLQSMKRNTAGDDFWHTLPEETKQDIQTAKSQLERGEGIPHEEVMKQVKEQFLK